MTPTPTAGVNHRPEDDGHLCGIHRAEDLNIHRQTPKKEKKKKIFLLLLLLLLLQHLTMDIQEEEEEEEEEGSIGKFSPHVLIRMDQLGGSKTRPSKRFVLSKAT